MAAIQLSESKTSPSLVNRCENAYNLIKEGKETEAKNLFPMEYYLIKKYLHLNIEDFMRQLTGKLNLL